MLYHQSFPERWPSTSAPTLSLRQTSSPSISSVPSSSPRPSSSPTIAPSLFPFKSFMTIGSLQYALDVFDKVYDGDLRTSLDNREKLDSMINYFG